MKFLPIKDNPPPIGAECDILATPISKPGQCPIRLIRMTYRLIEGHQLHCNPPKYWHDEHGHIISSNVDVTHWAPTLDLYEYKLK